MSIPLYIPLPLRLALLSTLIVGITLWIFGSIAYTQSETRAYQDLDNTLKSRAASVRLSKSLMISPNAQHPILLNSVDGLGTGGVAIEVFALTGKQFTLLATTTQNLAKDDYLQTGITNLGESRVPWDPAALHTTMVGHVYERFTTITYRGQHIRVYTVQNADTFHSIQTAHSERAIEQSLTDLLFLLLRGSALAMLLMLLGGWLISWGVLATVRRMSKAAEVISTSGDFSKRVQNQAFLGSDELTRLAATFNQMLTRLEESYKRQQRFVADASHELRAPITSIRCNLDLVLKAPDLAPEEVQGALADAQAEAERMGRLVSDLLLLAHADSTTNTLQRAENLQHFSTKISGPEVDLDSLLLEVFRQYRTIEQKEKNVHEPNLTLHHIVPVKIYGDADQLKQALVALVDNAYKYTPHEGQISLSLTERDGWAIIQVHDSGIGIFPEDLPHIFERFYRADRARTRNQGGSGLGLAIVQSIAQEHHGSVEVESTPGRGSTFTLKIPTPVFL